MYTGRIIGGVCACVCASMQLYESSGIANKTRGLIMFGKGRVFPNTEFKVLSQSRCRETAHFHSNPCLLLVLLTLQKHTKCIELLFND